MKLHRFIGDFDLNQKIISIPSSEVVHQLIHVLRVKPGTEIVLCNGQGQEARVKITEVGKSRLEGMREELFTSIPESKRKVTLYAALIKGEHFEFIAEKATEVGVSEIVPLITNRTIKLKVKMERIQKIITEAAEQSGRGVVPTLGSPLTLKEALAQAKENEKNIFFDLNSPSFSPSMVKNSSSLGCFIGPEGGWDEKERQLAEDQGCVVANVSQFTFRAETAAIITSYLVCNS